MVTATGAKSVPRVERAFQAVARLTFDPQSRRLSYDIRLTGSHEEVAGVYLHRRAARQNGGVATCAGEERGAAIVGRRHLDRGGGQRLEEAASSTSLAIS
jgi:hypothetical protein